MKKKLSLLQLFIAIAVCCGTTLCLSSCSSDDEEEIFKDVAVKFSLFNEKGEETTTFKYGENIIFDLVIKNRTDQEVELLDSFDDSNYYINAFIIYTSDGLVVGYPYDLIRDAEPYLLPRETIHWRTCWMVNPTETTDYAPFISTALKEPLPKGNYYTVFSFLYNGERKVYKASFRVIE